MAGVTMLKTSAKLAAVVSAVAAAQILAATPAPAEPGCADVEVIVAGAASGPPGIGGGGQAMVEAPLPHHGFRPPSTYSINFPPPYYSLAAADSANDATARIS